MRNQLLVAAWNKLQGIDPPEDLPDHPIDALYELLPTEPIDVAEGFVVGLDESTEDPWREMIVGQDPGNALRAWVFEAAHLLVAGRGPSGTWLAVDEELDPKGNNRVYLVSADGKSLDVLFPDVERFVKWIVSPKKAPPKPSADRWSKTPASAGSALTALWKLHPAELYRCHCTGTWPTAPAAEPTFTPDAPGWRRTALLWTLAHFVATKDVGIPEEIVEEDLSPVHADLIDHLIALQAAIAGDEVPPLVTDLALDDDESIARAAKQWMVSFERAREKPDDARSEATTVVTEKTKGALLLLRQALDELVRLEYIEISEQRKGKLVEDMLEAVVKAASPYATVPKLIEALLDSPHVEEVFADDATLGRVLSAALGLSR